MLAQSAALLFFVPEEMAEGEPFERFSKFTLMRGNYAGERRRKLGAQRHFAFALVGEIKKLIDNFWAALFFVKLCGFEGRPFPFDKTVTTTHFPPARKDVIAPGALLGKEIAKTG